MARLLTPPNKKIYQRHVWEAAAGLLRGKRADPLQYQKTARQAWLKRWQRQLRLGQDGT